MIYELYLEGQLADIRQDLGMQLSYAIDDINKYGSRETSFSKTIVLPGTANNNRLLGFVSELGSNNTYLSGGANINSNFNPAQTTKAELRANGLLLLKGVFRLTGIVKDGELVEYEGNLFGELGGFISAIGNGKLEDLDFSEYNHVYTRDNIVGSWDSKITKNVNGYFDLNVFGRDKIGVYGYNLNLQVGDIIVITNADNVLNNGTYTVQAFSYIGSSSLNVIEVSDTLFNDTNDDFTIQYPSSDANYGKGYFYPLIDYGRYSAAKLNYDYRTFRPALFVKEYIDKIFLPTGYTYESNFFDSAFFKKLIIPNNASELKTLTSKLLDVGNGSGVSTDNSLLPFLIQNKLGNFTVTDNKTFTYSGSSFVPVVTLNIDNFQLSTSNNIEFNLKIVLKVTKGANVTRYGFNGNDSLNSYDYTIPQFRLDRSSFSNFSGNTITLDFYSNVKIGSSIVVSGTNFNNGTYIVTGINNVLEAIEVNKTLVSEMVFANFNYAPQSRSQTLINLNNYSQINRSFNVTINSGDKIEVEVYFAQPIETIIARGFLNVFSTIPVSAPAGLNDLITLNDSTPRNILQKDFFSWILKMFNLYITEDKVKEKHLIIEPYVDYYDLNSYEDWTYKVARDKPWNIKPMGMLNGRFFEYKYKEDNDFYNEGYKKKYNLPYGSNLQDTGFQFAKDKQTTEIGFSPTPLVKYSGEDKVVSAIYKVSKGNDVDQEEQTDSNIRILMVKKITGVDAWYITDNGADLQQTPTNLGGSLTGYGYAGHFDDPTDPTIDINFGAAEEIYCQPNTYPSNNLFNTYWSGYIGEIADKDSKILTCHVYLTELDIAQLDFSKPVFIDGSLWRINKIMDFDASSGELTKVELLKVINNG